MVPLKYYGETLDAGRIPTLKLAPEILCLWVMHQSLQLNPI
jgi:hypothetical protein